MPYAEVNDIRMYYEEQGRGEPLVLLHGATGTIDFHHPSRCRASMGISPRFARWAMKFSTAQGYSPWCRRDNLVARRAQTAVFRAPGLT